MHHLSWILLHGIAAWIAALLAASLAGPLLWRRRRRRLAARHGAAALARLGEPSRAKQGLEDGRTVTLSGTLSAGDGPCQRFDDGAPAAVAGMTRGALWGGARAGRLALVDPATGRTVATIEGPVQILAGSREVRCARRVGPAVNERGLAAGAGAVLRGKGEVRLDVLHDGDAVRVRGRLRRDAPDEASGAYRDDAAVWAIVAREGEPVLMASERPPRVAGVSRARWTALAVMPAAAFAVGSTLLGEIALRAVHDEVARSHLSRTYLVDPLRTERIYLATLVAAVSPLHRRRALNEADSVVGWRCAYDGSREQLEQAVSIAQQGGPCEEAVQVYLRHHVVEDAAALAASCGDARALAHVEYQRGRFVEADRALSRAEPATHDREDLLVRLLASGDVADAARREANAWNGNDRADALRCLADAIDLRGGVQRPSPAGGGRKRPDRECLLLEADALQGDERTRLLQALAPEIVAFVEGYGYDRHTRSSLREIASLLALETELGASGPAAAATPGASCPQRASDDPALLADPTDLFFNPPLRAPGLSLRVLAALEQSLSPHAAPCARLMQVAVPVAAFEALTGDPAEALRVAQLVLDHAPPRDRARASAFAAAVTLYAGDPERARERIAALPADSPHLPELRWLAGLATGRPAEKIATGRDTPFRDMEAWLEGDLRSGRRLAVLAQERPAPLGLVRLAARRIDGGQGALGEWLRWGDKHDLWKPASIAATMARLRDVAEALGEPALARDHEATRRAFHEALSRRDIAVPLAVLDGL